MENKEGEEIMFDSVFTYFLGDPPADQVSLMIYTVFKYGLSFYLFDQLFGVFRMVKSLFK